MFEKELEEYKNRSKWKGKIFMKDEEICFKDGAEFGYNKFKDANLQQGFEIICKRIAELEKENAELKSKNCWKTCEYAEPKSQWISQHIQDVEQLTKAKEIIKDYMIISSNVTVCGVPEENRTINVLKLNEEAEQFLREVEK